MAWDRPILTDSADFRVFSLAGLRKIKEEGVYFHSHIDGKKIFMGPEESMQIQSNLASTIAMAFDECPSSVADREYMSVLVDRTSRWLMRVRRRWRGSTAFRIPSTGSRCCLASIREAFTRDIRIRHAKEIAELDLDGYAIGGLAVGESHEDMYRILEANSAASAGR